MSALARRALPAASAPSQLAPEGRPPLMRELRRQTTAGSLVVGLFFGGIGLWAAITPLAGAAIAPGVVSPDGSRRTVQHLEGGIIREILVRDGSAVRRGDALIVLEDVRARADHDVLRAHFHTLAATEARLLAEQAGDDMRFPDWLVEAGANDPEALQAMVAQRALFETRTQALADREAILRRRIAQLREEIAGLEAQIEADSRQIELVAEETRGVAELYRKGLERKGRLLALQRARAEIEGDRAERRASIARARQAIGETELQIIAQRTTRLDSINRELSETQSELAEIEQRLAASRDVLERTLITAPIDGTVVGLRFRTAGGVVRPGEPILDIVPAEEELLIDARVAPTDIDAVRVGLPARVVLTAFNRRTMPRIEGRVRQVSADAIEDAESGQRFYLARIDIDRAQLAALDPSIELTPGMPAEVYITTGERTALDYLLAPIRDSLRRAFRET